jgi:hypothetical protein
MIGVFLLHGLECGICGLPAHGSVRTTHMDERKRPCHSVGSAPKQPDRRGGEPPVDLPRRAPAPVRSPAWRDRRSA